MRKVKLTPIERDVLCLLEEAGEESLECIRATLDCSEDELNRAVNGLKRLGYVSDSIDLAGLPAVAVTDIGQIAIRT
jgi:hypothetical protein